MDGRDIEATSGIVRGSGSSWASPQEAVSQAGDAHTRQRKLPIPISQPRCPTTQLYRRPDVGRCPGNRRMVITDLISAGAVGGRGSSGGLGGR